MEGDRPAGLRVRITQTLDVVIGENVVTTEATIDDVCAAVRAWLEKVVASAG